MSHKNFWQKIKKPFFCLAPMADVTDAPFRQIIAKYGKPDIFWTEFTSADGLCSKEGRKKLKHNLIFTKKEKPIIAQLFTSNPDKMREACTYVSKLGFQGIDINMGCPDRKIEKSGAGASLMKNPALAKEIIKSAIEGANGLPISVKTRLGYNKDELETWLPELLSLNISAITVHGRTRKEMSLVPAKWDRIKRAVEIRNELKSKILIIGNGDVLNLEDAKKKAKESGVDGVMLGRAIFGNPWLFNKKIKKVSDKKRLEVLVEHTKLFEKIFKRTKNFAIMKKHFKAYCSGFQGAKELRIKLMEAKNAKEVESLVKIWLKGNRIS
jgi:nifR3 family TIM-barrel protein